jgi:hypothetical protein
MNARNQQRNPAGQNQQNQNRNQGAGARAQAPPQRDVVEKDHLQIANGSISCIKSKYWFSEEASATLHQHFSYLQRGEDKTRCQLGYGHGFDRHPHALGAFLRSYFDDLIMYKYARNVPSVLDVGGSLVRTLSRYTDNVNWGNKVWSMTPMLGVKDTIRKQDNYYRLIEILDKHNHKHRTALTLNDVRCEHTMQANVRENCACGRNYPVIKSVESFYYPGVADGIYDRLCHAVENDIPSVAYVVMNNYSAATIKLIRDRESVLNKDLSGINDLQNHIIQPFDLIGTLDCDGKPESVHTISYYNGKLKVSARVEGNAIPYIHYFPLLSDEQFYTGAWTFGDKDYMIMFERLERVMNGDVPFDLIRLRATKIQDWSMSQMDSLPHIWLRDATIETCVVAAGGRSLIAKREDIDTIKKIWTKLTEDDAADKIIPISHKEKSIAGGDIKLDMDKRVKTKMCQNMFVRWLQVQLKANKEHDFYIRQRSDGLVWITVVKYKTWMAGLLKTEDKNVSPTAKLSDVILAYLNIGIKTSVTSIMHSMVTQQRSALVQDETMFGMSEAYAIARLLRCSESTRFTIIVGDQ